VEQLQAFVRGIQRQLYRADAREAKPQIKVLDAVVQQQRDAFALGDAQRVKGRRDTVGAPVGLGISDSFIAAHHKRVLANALCLLTQDVRRYLLLERQARQKFGSHQLPALITIPV
jgi:predicted nucleic acid-binding protein